jgi:hypothetical protein
MSESRYIVETVEMEAGGRKLRRHVVSDSNTGEIIRGGYYDRELAQRVADAANRGWSYVITREDRNANHYAISTKEEG